MGAHVGGGGQVVNGQVGLGTLLLAGMAALALADTEAAPLVVAVLVGAALYQGSQLAAGNKSPSKSFVGNILNQGNVGAVQGAAGAIANQPPPPVVIHYGVN